jgi:hypothetical protein
MKDSEGLGTLQILDHKTFLMRCRSHGIIPKCLFSKVPTIVYVLPKLFNVLVRHFSGTRFVLIGIRRYPSREYKDWRIFSSIWRVILTNSVSSLLWKALSGTCLLNKKGFIFLNSP